MSRPKNVNSFGENYNNFPTYHFRIRCDQKMITSMKKYTPDDLSVRAKVILDAFKANYDNDQLKDRGE